MKKRNLKQMVPSPFRQAAKILFNAIPPRYRYTSVFWETYRFLEESQRWSKEKLEEFYFDKLINALKH